MSSAHLLVFTPRIPGTEWFAGSNLHTLVIRRGSGGFRAFIHTWSDESQAFVTEAIPFGSSDTVFASREDAEIACQVRYEQARRWGTLRNA